MSGAAYDYLDIVTNAGSSYMALQDVPVGTLLTNTTYWMVVANKGDTGDTGAKGQDGNLLYATFDVDEDGHLIMTYPETYDGVQFALADNGHLIATYN